MKKDRRLIFIILAFIIICFPLYYKIQNKTVCLWDESRNAVNAIEMLQNKNYLVRHFDGSYDSWETKPPLLIWLQVAAMNIFGINIFAIRFPSLLASIVTCLVIVVFFAKVFKDFLTGLVAIFVLVTCQGFIGHHIARTGDHDALLVLFSTCLVLVSYLFGTASDKRKNEFQIFVKWIFITLGFFTKSISIFFITPGILIYLLYKKEFAKVFKLKFFYAGLILFISTVFAFYFLHEKATPGYVHDVWQNEWFPRASNTATIYQYNQSPWYYYINNIFGYRFVPWIYLLPVLLYIFYKYNKDSSSTSFINYLLIVSAGFLFVISCATTNVWYDAPVLPLLSIITSISLVFVARFLWERFFVKAKTALKFSILFIAALPLIIPYVIAIKFVSRSDNNYDTCFGYMLKDASLLDKTKSYKVFHTGFTSAVLFYTEVLHIENFNIEIINSIDKISPGDFVITSKPEDIELLKLKFSIKKIKEENSCALFELSSINQ